jgi:hypothetical protein
VAEASPEPVELTPAVVKATSEEESLEKLVREKLEFRAELRPEAGEPATQAVATVPEAQPAAEEKSAPQAEETPAPQAEEKPEPQAGEKTEAAPGSGEGDGLYRGMLELDVTAEDAKQIPIFLSQLQQLPNLQVVSFKGLPGGNSIIALAISHPLPLPDIIKRMSPVESVTAGDKEVHVVLKVPAF